MKIIMTDGFKKSMARLGLRDGRFTGGWQKSLLDWCKTYYWYLLPYSSRPGYLWYRFTCWAWHRYTTIHPRTMPWHTWTDRDMLLPHVMFELLVQFVELEKPDEHFDLSSLPDARKKEWEKLFATYHWWRYFFVPFYLREREGKLTADDDVVAVYSELTRRCHDLIDVRHLMWT